MKKIYKRMLSFFMAWVICLGLIQMPVMAETQNNGVYNPCFVLFAQQTENSINITGNSISINGDIITNGTVLTVSNYSGINGSILEDQENCMIDYHSSIEELYFGEEVRYVENDYVQNEYNENINVSTFVEGDFNGGNNVSLNNSALMTIENINIEGGNFNSNNAVIYSQFGDIYVNNDNFSSNGLIYAPLGKVFIESGNVNISGCIIAQEIEIIGEYNVNINKNESFIKQFKNEEISSDTDGEDCDYIDIGTIYAKNIQKVDDIIYAGEGIYCVKNQLQFTANESVTYDEIEKFVESLEAEIVGYIQMTNDYQIEFQYDINVEELKIIIDELQENTLIKEVSFNYVIESEEEFCTNDAEWNSEWNEQQPKGRNWGIEAIKLESALINLGVITSESSNSVETDISMLYDVKIGLMDGQFDTEHNDLVFSKVWNNDTDENNSHGTHVAGIMGAEFNNGLGITGISVKNRLYGFSTSGDKDEDLNGKTSFFFDKYCLALLIGNNVKVINHSLGNGNMAFYAAQGNENALNFWEEITPKYETFLVKLIEKGYDFLIVTSAGNSNDDIYYKDDNEKEAPYGYINLADYDENEHPNADVSVTYGSSTSNADEILNETDAKYDDEFQYSSHYRLRTRVVSVGSFGCDSAGNYYMSDFSCRGSRVDILAPGEKIYSCSYTGNGEGGTDYEEMRGTSMAAPHVSGALGLAYSYYPAISASKLKSAIIVSAADHDIIENNRNYKVLDAAATIEKVKDVYNRLKKSNKNVSTNEYSGIAIGIVTDEDGNPLSNVSVTATLASDEGLSIENSIEYVVCTDGNGEYDMILPPGEYLLQYGKSNFLGETVYYNAEPEETTYIDTVVLFKEKIYSSILLTLYGRVQDAISGIGVEGATVKFRKGWNNTNGKYVSTIWGDEKATTDGNGAYSEMLSVGAYTVEITKSGYIKAYANIVVSPNANIQYTTITPILDDDEYRVILSWGDVPSDLDSHLVGNIDGENYHVYYSNKSYYYDDELVASLDLDDTSSYGPETITFTWKEDLGECTYYVLDFTNRYNSSSKALSFSSAKVRVYKGNKLVETFNIPVGYEGTKWNVFSIKDGVLTKINTIE